MNTVRSRSDGSNRDGGRGFSLIEVLAVMAVMGILLAISIPAVAPLLRASNINHAAGMITDEFNQARQFALTRNRDVEIRIYELPKKAGGEKGYRAFRSFLTHGTDPAQAKPFGKVKYLPEPVIISPEVKYSTLLDYNNNQRSGLEQDEEDLPGYTSPVPYVSFLFRANGGTSLAPITPPIGNWFLTLHLEDAEKDSADGLPKNYCNIQVDPVTGRVRTYRP